MNKYIYFIIFNLIIYLYDWLNKIIERLKSVIGNIVKQMFGQEKFTKLKDFPLIFSKHFF